MPFQLKPLITKINHNQSMGCVKSSNANDEGQSGGGNRRESKGKRGRVEKPKPWLSTTARQAMRDDFWQNAPQTGGRPEIWEALRSAAEGDLRNAEKVIRDNNIRLGNPDMSVCYDDSGTRYDLPWYVLSDLQKMEGRVLR